MIGARIEGATRRIGKAQGYLGLQLRDELIEVMIGGEVKRAHSMTSAWEPTPAEIERLINGAKIHVTLLGADHPPIFLSVGEAPGEGES